jgi:diguanylate cyclase (GGDEF)-like protein
MAGNRQDELRGTPAANARGAADPKIEADLQELAKLAAAICRTPIAVVSVDDGRGEALKAWVGAGVEGAVLDLALRAHALRRAEPLIIEDTERDSRFAGMVLGGSAPGVRFLAAVPVAAPLVTAPPTVMKLLATQPGSAAAGPTIGALCVIDREPRQLTAEQQEALRVLARQVGLRLELEAERLAAAAGYAELARYQAQLEAANDRLRDLAVTDALTGLRNRRAFEERLTFEFAMARRKGRDLAVVLLDADNFKTVNDRLGHSAGDSVLQQVAKVLQDTVRLTDLAVRFGGEEFAVILPENDEHSGLLWCARMQRALANTAWEHVPVTMSMGGAGLTAACVDGSHLVAMADQALYRAKRLGKNRFVGAGELEIARAD